MSDAAKRTLRTAVQTTLGLCVLLPPVIGSAGLADTLPWAAGAVAAAGGLSRLMALPAVQAALPSWLRTDAPVNGDRALRKLAPPALVPAPVPAPAAEGAAGSPATDGFGFSAGSGSGTGSGSGSEPCPGPGPGPGPGGEGSGA